MPSRVCHLEKLSSIASISSRMKRGERLIRETTTPGDGLLLDLVVDAREGDRELVVRVADVREVRVVARHHLRIGVDVEVALSVGLWHVPSIAAR